MHRILVLAVTVALCSPLCAVAQDTSAVQQPSVQLPQELDRILRDYETRYRMGGDTLAALFTEDGFVLAGGKPPVHGRAAIARHYNRDGGPLQLRAIAYATEGNVGYILGGYRYPPMTTDLGKFTLTLRRHASGRWLIYSDMDNPNARPRQP
jgi:ketosteroid isomerase-like protein